MGVTIGNDAGKPADLLQGTLELLILRTLASGEKHGYEIAEWIHISSAETLSVEEGALYPALHRLEQRRWLQAEWRPSETGREAKFYSLTRAGRKQLAVEKESWNRLSVAVRLIFDGGE